MNPTIIHIKEKKLIGCSAQMNFINNKTIQLWQSFMPRLREIKNKISSDLFSVQVYDDHYNFNYFDPSSKFTKWATAEVSTFEEIPSNMQTLIITEGLYAVFLHKGSNTNNTTHQYIFQEWLPASHQYLLDVRPHFEVLGAKYKNNDPSSEEEIWIPIKLKNIKI